MSVSIVVLDGATVNPGDVSWDGISKLGSLRVYDRTPFEKIIERIGNAEIVLTNKTPISAHTISQCPSVKFIGTFATGYNVIDTQAAKHAKILVANVPAYSTHAVAQFTFALLLNLCHKVQHHSDLVHAGEWSKSEDFCFWATPQIELKGKVLGLIGFGNIAQQVSRIAQVFDMSVLVYSRTSKPAFENDTLQFVGFDEMLAKSDVVSIHCPLFPETEHLLDIDAIKKMKPSAFLINTSRGAIVNEHDVAQALSQKIIAGFATDVSTTEPMAKDCPLLNAENCIVTPHIAWAPRETRERLLSVVEKNIEGFLNNNPTNIVNY